MTDGPHDKHEERVAGEAADSSDDKTDANEEARPAEERNLGAAKDRAGTGSGVGQPAPEQSPENVPAQRGEVHAVGVRRGMFGTRGSGDTSGYGGLVSPIVFPAPAQRPFGGWYDEVADALQERLSSTDLESAVESVVIHRGEITFHVRAHDLPFVAQMMRDDERLRFELCSGVSGVHYPDDRGRELHAVYHLTSMTHNRRVRLEVAVPDADPRIPSLVSIYPTLDWHERETYDMFGILFEGHPALTRILMPDDWPGHPQRKDYPLGGIPVEYKGGTIQPPDERRSYN